MVATEEQITATEVNTQHPDTAAKESVICYHLVRPVLLRLFIPMRNFFAVMGVCLFMSY